MATTGKDPPLEVTEADTVAAAVLGCAGVARMHAGGIPPVATYLPGRRVAGVRLTDSAIEVAVVARPGVRVPTLDTEVRAALAPLARGRAVDVHVADIDMEG
ncbi:hypothetical protein ATJ97_1432 [Georgenia soli]|uniref:Uncharacterized protein n=1 Tax=Georgenia soli TaxID=638953 RepID=A0A2A9EL22_9MICO|nr:hypothetical protein ATJ97_1432 [Georgenia soli]